MLTAEERILLHLLTYVRRSERFEVPFEMTQQGIALAVGVRRSHVSAVLGEMEGRSLITKRMAHVEAGGRRRKVYVLTPVGAQAAEALRTRIAATRVRVRSTGTDEVVPLSQALPLAPRGTTLLDLALAATDGVLDLEASRARAPPASASPRRFYGRSRELAAAREFVRSSAVCLTVRGLPGVGKTSFLVRLAEGADSAVIVWIRVTEWTTADRILSGIAAKLREVGRGVDLQHAVPIEDMLTRIAAEARELPLLVFLDDVHKAPDGLPALLAQLVRALAGGRGKVVVAGRRIPGFYSRREVALEGLVSEIELSGLDEASALRLLEDRGVPLERRADLVAATRGHPLFLELIAASGGEGMTDVRAYLREEVAARLDVREQEVLASLAVHRGPVAVDAIAPEVGDVGRLEGLAERSLVRLGGGTVDMHDLLREFFYSRLTTAQRLRLHAIAASHYEARSEPEARVEMLFHLLHAGRPKDAATLLGGIGRALAGKGLQDDVLRLLGLFDLRALEPVHRVSLLLLRGEILSVRGEWPSARETFDEARSLAEDMGDRRSEARAVLELGVIEYRHGDFEAARTLFDRALAIVGDTDSAVVARILNALGILEWQAGNLDAAADLYRRSRAAYEAVGDAAGVAGAINNLGILRWQRDDVDGALADYADALRLSEELGDYRTVAILYNNIGEAYRRKGEEANAAKFYDRSLTLSKKLGFQWQMGEVHRNLGRLLAGNRAVDHLRQALSIFENLGAVRDRDEVLRLLRERGAAS
ncbi:MAG TPA: tetratricopeptide repeat protein [Thermoplasmata archaeon]|nr:tetratricopeptide repeat protein [Thermoplasmata archaeon]